MSVLPILRYPDPALREVCAQVEVFDAALAELAVDMLDTMYAAPGRGLAPPQVDILARIFVFDVDWKTGDTTPTICVNPVVRPLGNTVRSVEESCLSIPDRPTFVTRPAEVSLVWQDVQGARHEAVFSGDAAVVVQHEADHLDGCLCIDYEEAG